MTTDTERSQMRIVRVFVCAACGRLAATSRAHTLTCSGACRVSLHRNPTRIRELRTVGAALNRPVSALLDREAIERLRPDLAVDIQTGELTMEDARSEVWHAFQRRVLDASRVLKAPRRLGKSLLSRESQPRRTPRPDRDTTPSRDRRVSKTLQRLRRRYCSQPDEPRDPDR